MKIHNHYLAEKASIILQLEYAHGLNVQKMLAYYH